MNKLDRKSRHCGVSQSHGIVCDDRAGRVARTFTNHGCFNVFCCDASSKQMKRCDVPEELEELQRCSQSFGRQTPLAASRIHPNVSCVCVCVCVCVCLCLSVCVCVCVCVRERERVCVC